MLKLLAGLFFVMGGVATLTHVFVGLDLNTALLIALCHAAGGYLFHASRQRDQLQMGDLIVMWLPVMGLFVR